jgi:predicted ATPase/DNA-binding NarL/FixJ family response regulator
MVRAMQVTCELPTQPTPLVGREGELDLARGALLRDEVRLLTFKGPAGVGKTRLALATADSLRDLFDNIFVANLAPVAEFGQVGSAVALAVGLPDSAHQPLLASLASRFANSKTLLILDNFEHVMPAADFVVGLLAMCPSVTILVTSREALRLRWEYLFPVRPLALPVLHADLDLLTLLDSPSVKLFVDRAQAADPSFELTRHNAAAVAELCVRLDGLPLALELAAARTPFLPPRAMLAHLRHRLDLLVDGAYDLPVRQRSARAAIGYSYDLLSPAHQALFRQLSVFPTGCTPEAAAAVALGVVEPTSPDSDRPAHYFGPVLESLTALVHKSLLAHDSQPDGEVRFSMLETVRAFAFEQLLSCGEHAQARARALAYYTALTEQAQIGLQGRHQSAWLALLDREHDNMRSVLRSCIDDGDAQGGMQLAGRLGRFWELRGSHSDAHAWLDDLLALPATSPHTLARALALSTAATLAASQNDTARAETFEIESSTIWRELGDRLGYAGSLSALALLAHRRGDSPRARTLLEDSLAVRREFGDQWGIARVQHQLGDVAAEQAQLPMARACYEESIVLWHALHDAWGIALCLESMAVLAQSRGDSARALRLIGAAGSVRHAVQPSLTTPVQRLHFQHAIAAAETALGPTPSAAAFAAGQAMSLDEAVLYARSLPDTSPSPQPAPALPVAGPFAWLTRREQEVATLLMRGLSNRQIAEVLVITERTAETHVCRILSKLGLGSRAQIPAWVLDHSAAETRTLVSSSPF